MLPKNVTDAEVSAIFSKYGNIKDLHILRGSQQTSKGKKKNFCISGQYFFYKFIFFNSISTTGCAFLKYETKEQAVAALDALNGIYKMEVCCLFILETS